MASISKRTCIICSYNFLGYPKKKLCYDCENKICPCGKSFKIRPYEIDVRKHCSNNCHNKYEVGFWKGKGLPEETRRKMSEKHKAIGTIPPNWTGKKRGKMKPEHKEKILKLLRENLKNLQKSKQPTSIEKAVYDFLILKGIAFERQKPIGNRYVVDVYIPSLNLVIEADGSYWHTRPEVKKRDKIKNIYLNTKGYKLIRLTEEEIKKDSFKERLGDIV